MELTVPLALDRSAGTPAVPLVMVTRLPAVPLTFQLVTVCVVAIGNTKEVGCTPLAMLVKVLAPEMVNAPAPSLIG